MGRSSSNGKLQNFFEELTMKSKLYQEHHARYCQQIEDLRIICCKQAERVVQFDELSMQRIEDTSTVNQLLSQIHELQDEVNSLNKERALRS